MALGKRLEYARKLRGMTQDELAVAAGMDAESGRATVQAIESRDSQRTKFAGPLARALRVHLSWLQDGEEPMELEAVAPTPPVSDNTEAVSMARLAVRRLPLISWVQAGDWADAADPYQPGDAEDWHNVVAKVGPRAFMLKVVGDSMTNPAGSPSAPAGSLIVVDPDITAENGSLVIAKLNDEATFKKLVIDSGQRYLKPLNPDYKQIAVNGNCTIVGVVKQILIDL